MARAQSEYAERVIVQINDHLSAEITVGDGGLTVEWIPRMPKQLNEVEISRYKDARNKMVASYAARTGRNVIMIDI